MADEGKTAAYVSWVTFKNTLDRLGQSMPNRIDKSVFPGYSGGTLVQLLPALKFLGLTREDGTPTEALLSLVKEDEVNRRGQLNELFRERYKDLFSLDLTTATMAQLTEKMSEHYGVTGSTLKKAVRFFLNGAAEIGIPLSNYLVTAKGTVNGGGPRRRIARKKPVAAPLTGAPVAPSVSSGTSKSISLRRGETLTLSVTADFFAMDPADLDFVFGLHRQMLKYEAEILSGQSQTTTGGEDETTTG